MRICTNCGEQFEDSELFCPKCGQEVQLVPNFETIESRMAESERLQREEERKREEERQYQLSLEKKRRARRRRIILIAVLIAAASVFVIIGLVVMAYSRMTNSYDYQLQMAQAAYEDGNADAAMEYAKKAVSLSNDNRDAKYLMACIHFDSERYEDAAAILEKLTESHPKDAEAYDLLFRVYDASGTPQKIRERLGKCRIDSILEKYADYMPQAPVIEPESGTYDKLLTVAITSETKGDIYYTTDGTTPNESSKVYKSPLKLKEGKTTLKALVIAQTGVSSDVTAASYEIVLDEPPAPEITPPSGTYRKLLAAKGSIQETNVDGVNISLTTPVITVDVPEGFTCYYSFDTKPTEKSTIYTEPVDMRVGEHVFYAVLASSQGKTGRVMSATYVYSVVTPTPTPTPTPEPVYYFPVVDTSEEEGTEGEGTENPEGQTENPDGQTTDPAVDPSAQPAVDPAAQPAVDPAANTGTETVPPDQTDPSAVTDPAAQMQSPDADTAAG